LFNRFNSEEIKRIKNLVFLKNPKIWFGIILFIGIIVSIILIIKALKPTPVPETKLCPREQTKTTCSDGSIKCVPICPYKVNLSG
jgi:hypothetical protein